jgi:DNA-binding NtrC family response regulator
MARLLVLSPTELVRDALALWLREAGHQVATCASDEEGEARLIGERIGAFFTSELLPRGRAIPTLTALRERCPGTGIVFVDEGPLRSARETLPSSFARVIGVDAVVRWPFGRHAVLAALERVLPKTAAEPGIATAAE